MLSEVFYWIFNMSISASVTGIIILLISKSNKIPAKILSILWAVPFIRMLIPIGLNSKFSLMTLLTNTITKSVTLPAEDIDYSMLNHIKAAESYFPIKYKTDLLKSIFNISAVIWIVVAFSILTIVFINYISAKIQIRNAVNLKDNIYISEKITSPLTIGIMKAKIILPEFYNSADSDFILMHENMHIKRKDNLWRLIAIATASIHWFNPLSWLFLKKFLESLELACDEAVIKRCNEKDRKNYAKALLNCAENKNLLTSAFTGSRLRVRIEHILSFKKLSILSMAVFIMFAVALFYILLTNAK